MDLKILHELYLKNRIVSTDSRNIIPGCLFFALKGENFNGNNYAIEAIEKGALSAVVDENVGRSDERLIRVQDVLTTLQQLALYHRRHAAFKILAITGSNGKTTTKELCKTVLSVKFKVQATQGNLNNHIGVPLTLLSMKSDVEIAIVEMGANHPGEIDMLCNIAEPDFGLITNIGKAHLEGFGGIEGVARAKGELFRHLISRGKTIFLNEGNSWILPLAGNDYPGTIRYNGPHSMNIIKMQSDPFLRLHAADEKVKFEVNTLLAGSYNAENVLAACTVGLYFDIHVKDIEKAIESYTPQNNRSQIIHTGKNTVFMDAYNANPSSMAAAIHEFLNMHVDKKLLILGEMREVGASSESEHQEIVSLLKRNGINDVICVGNAFMQPAQYAGYRHVASVNDLNIMLAERPLSGHFILVKGSRSNQLEKVLPLL